MKKILLYLTQFLLLYLWVISQSTANANTDEHLAAKQGFLSALNDMQMRLKQLPDNVALSYTLEERDQHGNGKRSHYLPSTKDQGSWTIVAQFGEPVDSALQFDAPVLIQAKAFSAEQAKLIDETDSTWVFVIPNLVNIGIGGVEPSQAKKTEKKVSSQLEQVLQTELVIDKNSLQFAFLHIYSKAPFKPTFLAQVEKFEIRI